MDFAMLMRLTRLSPINRSLGNCRNAFKSNAARTQTYRRIRGGQWEEEKLQVPLQNLSTAVAAISSGRPSRPKGTAAAKAARAGKEAAAVSLLLGLVSSKRLGMDIDPCVIASDGMEKKPKALEAVGILTRFCARRVSGPCTIAMFSLGILPVVRPDLTPADGCRRRGRPSRVPSRLDGPLASPSTQANRRWRLKPSNYVS